MPVFPGQELPTFSLAWGPGSSTEWWDSGANRVLDRKRLPVKGWFAELASISEQVQTAWPCPVGFLEVVTFEATHHTRGKTLLNERNTASIWCSCTENHLMGLL